MRDDIRQPPETQATPVSGETSDRVSMLAGMPVEEYLDADAEAYRPSAEARHILKALLLAPTLAICEALLRGERVPWWRLDFDQARRFRIRPGHEGLPRVHLEDFNDVPL
jgi:hypothetical protein